ncbi:MAG: MFS transporter [Francisellaceae bacterium]
MSDKNHKVILAWFVWFLAALFYALDYFQHTAPSVLLKPIALSMDIGINQVASAMAIYFPVYAISQMPAGMLLDRYGCKWTLSLSCLIMSAGILAFALEHSMVMLWSGRILVAIGSAFAFLGALKVASDVLPKKAFPIAVGLTNTIGVCGGIFGQVLLEYFIERLTWEGALWLIGFIGIGYSLILFLLVRPRQFFADTARVAKKFSWHDIMILKSWRLWLIALYAGIMVGTVVNAFSELYDVVFLEYTYHLSAETAASISACIFFGIAVGGPLHGVIANFIKSKKLWMIIANAATIVLFSMIILFSGILSIIELYFMYFMLGFFVSSMLLAFAVVDEIFPRKVHGTVLAVVNMTIGIAAAIFQHVVGFVSEYVNGGDIRIIHNPHTYVISFVILLVPLIASFFMITLVTTKGSVKS